MPRRLPFFIPFCAALLAAAHSACAADGERIQEELDRALSPAHLAQDEAVGLTPAIRVRVTARRHTILSSQSTGRIEELAVRDGDRFAAGDLLARLDSSLLEAQLERARAAHARQSAMYRMVRELADLQTKGEVEAEVARMDMEQAAAEMRAVERMVDRTRVTAPFPGRVAEVLAREMQFVSEGQPILEILDDSTLELEFLVPSRWMRWFGPGHRFDAKVEETGKSYAATVDRLGGKVDPLSQSVKVYATFLDPTPDLMEGMSGEALIVPPRGE